MPGGRQGQDADLVASSEACAWARRQANTMQTGLPHDTLRPVAFSVP
ncbi:hypothetical protein EV686_1089 [Paracandidimonas soli]|uniref:Uncharacterized protein n=1 Tax=Paracandidimonas soli TaxID=1917182 RepID=A0A4R3UWK2_9BURK|nr:hypothetical protein EV686_1089 [Paracandidimonas soli]